MNVSSQKKIAAKVMKVGLSRVRIQSEKEVEEALTRGDIRRLIKKGLIKKVEKKGPARSRLKYRQSQKKKGRRKGQGKRSGKAYALKPEKRYWIEKVRPLRKLLAELRDSGKLKRNDYRKLYLMVKGGAFRNKKHLLNYLRDKEFLKKPEKGGKDEKK